jgi:DNA-binding HxlR family transcriptional regulator
MVLPHVRMGEDGGMDLRPDGRPDGAARGLAAALSVVGDRWTLLVVNALLAGGARRFNELQQDLGGIATNVLSQRLKHLERAGLVVSHLYSTRPPRAAYELTAGGRELAGALRLLSQWGAEQAGAPGAPLQHAACGTALEARWYCPTCDVVVADDEPDDLRYL